MAFTRYTSAHALAVIALSMPWLLSGCAPLTVAQLPDASVITVRNGHAIAPDCNTLQQPSNMGMDDGPFNLTPRPSIAFGCATYGDLAKMIVNPQDLVHPQRYPGQSATTANGAVQRYYSGTITPLLTNGDTSNVTSGSSSGSSAAGVNAQGTGSGTGGTP